MARSAAEAIPASVRRQQMLDLIGRQGFARVADLSDAFQVSDVTVRSDLDLLDEQQAIRRVHGGAVLHGTRAPERSFEDALESSAAEKLAIAHTAAALVESGTSLILDVGTTTAAIARALVARDDLDDVTIITNGLAIALELERAIPRFQVIVTGGTLRPLQHSLVDPLAAVVLSQLHADLAFIGCSAVHPHAGFTNLNLPEADLKRIMIEASSRAIIVADASKLGRSHLGVVARLGDVDGLITDSSAGDVLLRDLRRSGLEVTVAAPA